MRRSGKSTLSILLLMWKRFSYVDFNDEGLTMRGGLKQAPAGHEIYGNVEYMIFDEIHNVEGWELFISLLRDVKRIIITGSNSKMSSGELSTHLTGRHTDYVLLPFSFKEHLRFTGTEIGGGDLYSTRKISLIKNDLENYMEVGGFPEALLLDREQVSFIYNDAPFKDVISRCRIRDVDKFGDFAGTLISYYSNEASLSSIVKVIDK